MGKKSTEEVCVKEMAACAGDETCKGLHMKVQMLMKKGGGDKKEGGYGGKGDDGKKDDGKKDDQKGDYGGKGDQKPDYGKVGQKVDNLKDYGKKLLGGRKLHQHGAHPPKDEQKGDEKKPEKDGDKKPEKDGENKPGYGKEGGDKAPSAELKAAMEACKKNELCRALMECKMKHKESGGKDHDHKHCDDFSKSECESQDHLPCSWDDGKCAMKKSTEEVCVKEMAACAGDETCKGLHMKVQMLMKKGGDKKEGGYGGK